MDVEYREDADERVIAYRDGDRSVEIATPQRGYGMLIVRTPQHGELERYYGLEMALDHAAEVLGRASLPAPEAAADMGI